MYNPFANKFTKLSLRAQLCLHLGSFTCCLIHTGINTTIWGFVTFVWFVTQIHDEWWTHTCLVNNSVCGYSGLPKNEAWFSLKGALSYKITFERQSSLPNYSFCQKPDFNHDVNHHCHCYSFFVALCGCSFLWLDFVFQGHNFWL